MPPPAPFTPPVNIPVGPKRSPYEAYEVALLRYIVRYGERILFQYTDEETNEEVVIRLSEYIRSELERDDLTFYTPLFKSMMMKQPIAASPKDSSRAGISLPIPIRT